MGNVKLVTVTPDAESQMAYIARVSNPKNQDNDNFAGLLKYCINHGHWSVFEQAYMTLQEFSQRYADVGLLDEGIPIPDLRRQDTTNRQNSIDDIPVEEQHGLRDKIAEHFQSAEELYKELLEQGIAKECARFVLPIATPTRIYMTGSVRSWIHYIDLRSGHGTQKEHTRIADECKVIFTKEFPVCAEALGYL